jgi:hypothetical protein
MSEWLEAITKLRAEQSEKPAPGFKTREEIQKDLGLSQAGTSRVLSLMVATGRAEMRKFRIENGGCIRPVPHFRLKGKKG